jgi:uncharacterized membrane protein
VISRRSCALAGIVIAMIVWGSTFVVTKAAIHEIPPLTLTFLRFLVAAAILVPLAAARGGLRRLPQPLPLATLVLMGLTGVAIFHVGFTYAMVYGSATQGAIVFALVPAAVVVAAVVGLKEAPSKRRITGILLSVCGVALVVATGESGSASPARCSALPSCWSRRRVGAYTVLATARRHGSSRRDRLRVGHRDGHSPARRRCGAVSSHGRIPRCRAGSARYSWASLHPPWRSSFTAVHCGSWMRAWWAPTSTSTQSSGC